MKNGIDVEHTELHGAECILRI